MYINNVFDDSASNPILFVDDPILSGGKMTKSANNLNNNLAKVTTRAF